jgi:hypothetical protein
MSHTGEVAPPYRDCAEYHIPLTLRIDPLLLVNSFKNSASKPNESANLNFMISSLLVNLQLVREDGILATRNPRHLRLRELEGQYIFGGVVEWSVCG